MKNVIITGASSGIGSALARLLDKGEYRLVLNGRNEDRLKRLKGELKGEHLAIASDVRSYEECVSLVERCKAEFGSVDVLVNNAGLGFFDPLDKGTIEDWHTMVDINVKGVLNCLHAALPELKASHGHIVNIGSVASHHVFPESGVYCATKHALFAISESIRLELNGQVKVTTISPGAVDTDFINKTHNEEILDKMKDYFKSGIRPSTVAAQIKHVLEAPKEAVINEVIMRPFR